MSVQQRGHRAGVGADSGDVRGGRKTADFQRAVVVSEELFGQLIEVDAPICLFADGDHVRDGFAPG